MVARTGIETNTPGEGPCHHPVTGSGMNIPYVGEMLGTRDEMRSDMAVI